METIKEVLMRRDSMTEEQAEDLITDAKCQLDDYLRQGMIQEAEDICEEYFSLEPDYLDELI